jgi:hypothetical protein
LPIIVQPGDLEPLESQARYIARPTMAMETPPDPHTGATRLVLDPLQWIDRIAAHIPDPGTHTRRSSCCL